MLGRIRRMARSKRAKTTYLVVMSLAFLGAYFWLPLFAGEAVSPETPATSAAHGHGGDFKYFEPLLNHEKYNALERTGLISVLIIAIVGLLYALMLRYQVLRAPKGTPKMQEIAAAVREGANAYLGAQFRKIGPLIVVITVALWFTKYQDPVFAWGRAARFWWVRCSVGASASSACVWRPPATCVWPRRPAAATAKPCSWATAPVRWQAC